MLNMTTCQQIESLILNMTYIELLIDCITDLKHDFNRSISKYKSFTRHQNYYENIFHFFSPSIRMRGKSINFDNKKNQQNKFL